MAFDPKTPYLTTDGIVECYAKGVFLGIVLIERKNPPHGFALPGGFVDRGERVEDALRREMREEIGLDVDIVALLGIYSDPSRDPRLHTASAVFIARTEGMPQSGDDAKKAFVVKLEELAKYPLCFDHAAILDDYRCYRKLHDAERYV
jgi:8-oxo-dGTP diphosphatase